MVFENKEEETDLKSRDKRKEDYSHSQQLIWNNFTVSLWDMRKEVLYPISIAIAELNCTIFLPFQSWTNW